MSLQVISSAQTGFADFDGLGLSEGLLSGCCHGDDCSNLKGYSRIKYKNLLQSMSKIKNNNVHERSKT